MYLFYTNFFTPNFFYTNFFTPIFCFFRPIFFQKIFICYSTNIYFTEIVDRLGVGVLHQYDREGHTPLHWAALGGHSHVVRFFVECRAPVDMPARNELGSQPIHWAGKRLIIFQISPFYS